MPTPSDDFLRHLVQKALALPPAARATFVANRCRNDEALRRQLAAALAAAGDTSFRAVAEPPDATLASTPSPSEPSRHVALEGPGTVIGRYRLLQQIGEGGFGSVFLAEQSEPVQRQVALKIVKLGMDTAQVVARFEQERQALAVMDHPHIAKVLDAGSTATGRPYFVMELCRGEPLTDYCDENRLSIDERLALFEQVCHAVQHAHGKGIIHRDLKPSNVLVGNQDGRAHAKVIDFGIAKATQAMTDRTLFTEAQQVIGTLLYMSPEQAEGSLDIDTRTDVYALGVILYELLSGSTPFDRRTFQEATLGEVHRLIREVEPHKPSTRIGDSKAMLATIAAQRSTEEKRLPALVRGELDWIVMKAIDKDRSRRYSTANALAEDVARFRRGEAVEAAPPSASYRLKKFLRRYRGPVIAAAIVFVALLAGIAGTLWGMLEAKEQEQLAEHRAVAEAKQRERADGERDRAVRYRNQALDALRATTGEDVEKLIGSRTELTSRERDYLEAIAQRWLAFAQQAGEDVESRELRAEGLARVAKLRGAFDDGERVRAGLEEALATWQRLQAEFPEQVRYERELVISQLDLAGHLSNVSDDEAAAARYRSARDLASRLAERFPDVAPYRFLLARAHEGLGYQFRKVGNRGAARRELERAIELQEKLAAESPGDLECTNGLLSTRHELAVLLTDLGELEHALREYEAIRSLQLELLARTPDDAALRASAANSLQNVATALQNLGKLDRARREYQTAIGELERLAADFPVVPEHRRVLARTRSKLGSLFVNLGDPDAGQAEYTAARKLMQALVGDDRGAPDGDLARIEYRMAELAADRGESDRAIELFDSARGRFQRLAADHPDVLEHRSELADTLNQLGIAMFGARRLDAAEPTLLSGRDLALQLAAEHPNDDELATTLGNVHNTLGLVYKQSGRRDEALVELEAARDVRRRIATRSPNVPNYQITLGGSHCNVGNLLLDLGDPSKSIESFDDAVKVLQAAFDRERRDAVCRQFLRNSLMGRGRAHGALQRWAEAAADWDRCAELSVPDERSWFVQQRALARARAGQVEQALAEAEAMAAAGAATDVMVFAARVIAIAAGMAAERKQSCGDRAMALLQAAVQEGWPDAATLHSDADFAALRDREDFRRFVGGS